MDLTPENIAKMRVAEIREELKRRGVDSNGSKAQLIARLTETAAKEAEEEKAADPEKPPEESEPASAAADTTIASSPKAETAEQEAAPGTDEDGEIKPKHTPIVYNLAKKDAATLKADEDEKKRRRAERFGIVDVKEHEAKRMKARSERFNLKFTESESAKMEQRAKRFATTRTEGSTPQKDGDGLIDLSHIVTSSAVTEEEKKKRRAERFGIKSK